MYKYSVLQRAENSHSIVGITLADQRKKLFGPNFDGASVNLGSKNSVSTMLTEQIPHQVSLRQSTVWPTQASAGLHGHCEERSIHGSV